MTPKKILFITGTRADYGKIKPLMSAIENDPQFELFVFITGMHLSKTHGSTYIGVEKDGWRNTHVDFASASHDEGMPQHLSNITGSLSNYIRLISPDLTVVHGDRIEALSGVISAALQNCRTAHIEGGEVSGTIDESIRHAITKLSHEHFVCSESAKLRVLKLGEQADRIFVIGSPDIDVMLSTSLPSLDSVKEHYEIPFDHFFIAMLHPVTTDLVSLQGQARVFVEALQQSGRNGIIVFPNNDPGNQIILAEYTSLINEKKFRLFPSIRFESFLTLLKNCDFIIGNSSAGIREAGIYGIPSIDIGTRQQGRYDLNILKNLQHVDFDCREILRAMEMTREHRHASQVFGDGTSVCKFMKVIKSESFWKTPIQKRITY